MQKPLSYIPTLDGWRAIAIAAVLLCHSFPSTSWTMNGSLGVNLFFAISGFLITSRLQEEQSLFGRMSLKNFYTRRAFRILPAAFAYLIVIGAITALGLIREPTENLWSCLLFVRNYSGQSGIHGWYTDHFWSLAVEEHFYLFWPALLVLSGTRRARWIAPLLAIAFAVWRALDMRNNWIADYIHAASLTHRAFRTDYRMDSLLWGATLGLWSGAISLSRLITGRAATAVVATTIATAIAFNVRQPQSYMAALAVLFPVAIAATVAQPSALIGRALESKALRSAGRLSYSLYLWQQLFFSQYHHGPLQRFPQNLVLALGCAFASYRFVERPLIRLGHRLTAPRSRTAQPQTAQSFTAAASA